jgi:amino acid adenylation domain-containing protein
MSNDPELALSPAKRTLLENRIQGRGTATGIATRPVKRRGVSGPAPLSPAQEQLWHFSQLAPGNPVYNESVSIRKDGPLDLDSLRAALNELIRRHQIWRSTFEVVEGEPRQVVHPAPAFQLSPLDLSWMGKVDAEREAIRMAAEVAKRPYNLEQGPLIRPLLVRFAVDHHRLYLAMHHLIFDGVSLYRVILPELIALYGAFAAGRPSPLVEPPIQYADYAAWERTEAAATENARALEYWRRRLADAPSLPLPLDHPRPPRQRFRGGMESIHIPKDLADKLDRLSREAGGTFFQAIACAFAVLLHRYSSQDDVVFGTVIDLRERPEFEAMVGYCLTPLVVRADLSGDPTFVQLLGQIREVVLDGMDHKVPFQQLVRELQPSREPGSNPIFQTMVVLEPPVAAPDPAWSLHQMEAELGNAVGHAKVDLHIELDRRPEGHVAGRLIYNSDLFERDTARRVVDHWNTLLEGIVAGPNRPISELPLLTEAERHRQLVEWNATAAGLPASSCVHEMVTAQAQRSPDKTAVAFADQVLTYGELEQRANLAAHRLRRAGAGPGTIVAICVERSMEMVVGMLGILKSGAAYLPLDPRYPPARLAFMLGDAGAEVVLTQRPLVGSLPHGTVKAVCIDEPGELEEGPADAEPPKRTAPESLAYVMYTSGSTGRPKGVRVSHANVINLIMALAQEPGVGPDDTVLSVASYSFDMSVGDVWATLGVGARLILASRRVAADGRRLGRLIDDSGISLMHATPATWQMLVDTGWRGRRRLVAVSGGEPLSPALAGALLDRCGALWNGYGPTETTVYATFSRVSAGVPITVGRPIRNVRAYVLNKARQLLPLGVPGEIWIGGGGVALGYLNRPEETAERFLADPFVPGGRMYRTGDLAQLLVDGQIKHLGRLDDQIKVRGFRIEPGEIEAALKLHPAVRSATVVAREDRPGDRRLIAYVVPDGQHILSAELRALLRRILPDYMVPSGFVTVDSLPVTPNGKLDRSALPPPAAAMTPDAQRQSAAPRTELEERLVRIWRQILGNEQIGLEDDFFELGGHSLLAARLLGEVEIEVGVQVPLASIFNVSTTVAGMASVIEASRREVGHNGLIVPIQSRGSAPILFFVYPDESAMLTLRHFVGPLGSEQPVLGLFPARVGRRFDQSRGIEELASTMLATIRSTQPRGPYLLAGFSLGGLIAYEIAGLLRADGEEVGWLGLLDTAFGPALYQRELWSHSPRGFATRLLKIGPLGAARVARNLTRRWVRAPLVRLHRLSPVGYHFDYRGAMLLGSRYASCGHDVSLDLFTSADVVDVTGSPTLGWEKAHRGRITVHAISGKHLSVVTEPNVRVVAEILSASLRRAVAARGAGPI